MAITKPNDSPKRRRISVGTLFALGVCALLACDDHDEFRTDVVLCEEAVSYLAACCPKGATASLHCHYEYDANSDTSSSSSSSSSSSEEQDAEDGDGWGGCNSREVDPDLSETQSKSLLGKSCEALGTTCAALVNHRPVGSL